MPIGKMWNILCAILILASLIGCGRERTSTTEVTLEKTDKVFMNEVFVKALNEAFSEDRREWYNAETGNSGAIVLEATYLNSSGRYCRHFREEVEIPRGAIPNWFDGHACKNENDVWVRQ